MLIIRWHWVWKINRRKWKDVKKIREKNVSDEVKKEELNVLIEEELNIKIRKVILNVPTYNLDFKLTDGRVELEENVVKSNDIVRLLQDVSKNKIDHKNEIICTLPIMFKVDDEETINPYGKHGNILYVKSILVSTDKKTIYDLATIVNSCNLDIIDITTTGLVDYYNFKSKELDTKNIAIVNLGSTTTNISIFSKGIFINLKEQ